MVKKTARRHAGKKQSAEREPQAGENRAAGEPLARVAALTELTGYLTEWAKCLSQAADDLELADAPVDTFVPGEPERAVLTNLETVPQAVRDKLRRGETRFTAGEVAALALGLAESLPAATHLEPTALVRTTKGLIDAMHAWLIDAAEAAMDEALPLVRTDEIYQFKIALGKEDPPIWRRIQIRDCTLGDLHYYIQAAMGWDNAHLYEFEIERKRYGVPDGDFGWGEEVRDASETLLSELVPDGRKQLKFVYEYDFGDSWRHEVKYEKRIVPEKGAKFPRCVEGAGACPPEDCGGLGRYYGLVDAYADPKDEGHDYARERLGRRFDPAAFDPKKATKALKRVEPQAVEPVPQAKVP